MRRERKRALTRDASSQKLEIGKREHHRLEQDEAGGVFNRNGQSGGSAYKGEMRAEYYFRIEAEGEHPEGSMVVGEHTGIGYNPDVTCFLVSIQIGRDFCLCAVRRLKNSGEIMLVMPQYGGVHWT